VTSRLLHDRTHVKAVGRPARSGKCGQPLRGPVEESFGPNLISAGRMRHGNTDLRQPLPQVPFLDWSGLPPCLKHLMSRERTACCHEFASSLEGLPGR